VKTFIINSENKVTAGGEPQPNAEGTVQFTTLDELTEVTRDWPMVRLMGYGMACPM